MGIMPDTAKEVVRLGGSLDFATATIMPDTLKDLARLAASSGASLTIHQTLMPDTMKEIARLAPGRVTFRI